MNDEEPSIKDRLADVLNSILCPVAGCWPLHGGHSEYYFDTDAESHVLEVWPVGIEEPEEHAGNGHHQTEQGLLYELAEFDFTELAKEIPLEHFHFSQRRSIFEIGWEEDGQQLELRVLMHGRHPRLAKASHKHVFGRCISSGAHGGWTRRTDRWP